MTCALRARKFLAGALWHHWDYPHQLEKLDAAKPVMARYITDNWRAYRTWGVSATNSWEYETYWKLRDGVDKRRKELKVDWDRLQRPGFSPDYIDGRYEAMPTAFERSDWTPHAGGAGPAAQQHAAAGLHRGQAGSVHQQGPQLLSGRDRGEATDHHQRLARSR